MPRPIRAAYKIPYGAAFGAVRANGARKHQGTDYHCPVGTPIYGTGTGGVVTGIGYNGDPNLGLGHNITITYPGRRITVDAHMRARTPLSIGSPVGPNTVVGYVGLTGNAVNASPPGSHDHHQVTIAGVLQNPESIYGVEPAGSGAIPIGEDDMPTADEVAKAVWTWQMARVDGSGADMAGDILRLGGARIYDIKAAVASVKSDLDYINQSAANPASLKAIKAAVAAIPAGSVTVAPALQTLPPDVLASIATAVVDEYKRRATEAIADL